MIGRKLSGTEKIRTAICQLQDSLFLLEEARKNIQKARKNTQAATKFFISYFIVKPVMNEEAQSYLEKIKKEIKSAN